MGTTPYVSRAKEYDRELSRFVKGKRIHIGERSWEGVGKPDYTPKFTLSPDEARYVATELWKLAEEIDGKKQKESVLKNIRANTEKIVKQAKREAMR